MTVQSGLADADSRGRGNGAPQAGGAEVSPGGCFGGGAASRDWTHGGRPSGLGCSSRAGIKAEAPSGSSRGSSGKKTGFSPKPFRARFLFWRTAPNKLTFNRNG